MFMNKRDERKLILNSILGDRMFYKRNLKFLIDIIEARISNLPGWQRNYIIDNHIREIETEVRYSKRLYKKIKKANEKIDKIKEREKENGNVQENK